MTANHIANAPEVKSSAEVSAAFEAFNRAFGEFRDTNDRRLAEIETRLSADVVTEEKLARIERGMDQAQARLDQLTLKSRRPALGGEPYDQTAIATAEHKTAFDRYVRTGESDGLKQVESKALSVGSGPDGGYLVPQPAERDILRRMAAISPIRALATVQTISTNTYKKAFAAAGPASGWVAETDNRPQTNSQTLADLTFPAMEIYAQPAATQTLLDDSAVDIDQWIASEVETVFAEKEGQAFVAGDGVAKPKGFLAATKVANASWSWDKIGYLATGVAGAFPASNPSDVLMDLIFALKGGYRQNGTFLMNRATLAAIRKFKASTGEYLWQPAATAGGQATLLNFPLAEAEDMPAIGTDSYSIAFGDFRRGYLIVDRAGIKILRDPFTAKPYVLFYVTKRVGGGVQDFEAIKLLKFGVS
jgi:HK97 family phage major capsid protein